MFILLAISSLEWNYAYSIHIDLIQTEEGNTYIIISSKTF